MYISVYIYAYICILYLYINTKSLKNVANFLNNEILKLPGDFKYIQWYHFVLDSIESKIYKQKPPKFKRKH